MIKNYFPSYPFVTIFMFEVLTLDRGDGSFISLTRINASTMAGSSNGTSHPADAPSPIQCKDPGLITCLRPSAMSTHLPWSVYIILSSGSICSGIDSPAGIFSECAIMVWPRIKGNASPSEVSIPGRSVVFSASWTMRIQFFELPECERSIFICIEELSAGNYLWESKNMRLDSEDYPGVINNFTAILFIY